MQFDSCIVTYDVLIFMVPVFSEFILLIFRKFNWKLILLNIMLIAFLFYSEAFTDTRNQGNNLNESIWWESWKTFGSTDIWLNICCILWSKILINFFKFVMIHLSVLKYIFFWLLLLSNDWEIQLCRLSLILCSG